MQNETIGMRGIDGKAEHGRDGLGELLGIPRAEGTSHGENGKSRIAQLTCL